MKRSLFAIAAVATLAGGPALAADLMPPYMPLKAPPPPPPVWSWTGCYAGANVGVGWASQNQSLVDTIETTGAVVSTPAAYGSETDRGVIGGGQIGCDYQFGHWGPSLVIGIQGQFDWGNLSGSHPVTAFPTDTMSDKTSNFDTLTARFGYSFAPTVLLYAKGGMAWATSSDSLIAPAGTFSESASWTATGWTVGGGLEYRIARDWSVFAEYDYLGFGTKTTVFNATPGSGITGEGIAIGQNVQEAKVGLNYRFNWWAPSGPLFTRD
jgi:outer membrane immunogenic protein